MKNKNLKLKGITALLIGSIVLVTGCGEVSNGTENNSSSNIEENSKNTQESTTPLTDESNSTEETTDDSIPVVSPFDINATRVDVPEDEIIPGYDLSDAVFVGDSRTEGLTAYGVLTTSTVLATRGLMASSVLNEKFVDLGNGKMGTVIEYLKTHSFKKIYIMFGINELGCNIETFKASYEEFISEIKAVQPDIEIYVESIIPMVSDRTDEIYNNEIIAKFNEKLHEVCDDKNVQFLNVSAAVVGEDGTLPENYSRDGIHLNVTGLKRFVNYIIMATYK